MEETAFLAPHGNSTFGFKLAGDSYEPDEDLQVPPVTKWIRNGRSFVFVSRADPAVHFYEPQSGKRWSIPLPPRSQPFDLAVWRNWLFVAAGGKTLLATSEWEAGTTWTSLPCDKNIHALAIQHETLIAIDDLEWLRYELTPGGASELSSIELPQYSSHTIEAAAYCDGKFATLSGLVFHGLVGKYARILCGSTFQELGHAGTVEGHFVWRHRFSFPPLKGARDIAIYRDVLVIAADNHGLITTRMSAEPMPLSDCFSNEYGGVLYDGFRQLWPDPAKRRPIVRVQACVEPAGFIVTSTERIQGRKVTPWEVAVIKKRTSATSLFIPYEQASDLIKSIPPGTILGAPLSERSRRAELRREAAKENKA